MCNEQTEYLHACTLMSKTNFIICSLNICTLDINNVGAGNHWVMWLITSLIDYSTVEATLANQNVSKQYLSDGRRGVFLSVPAY